jgi:glycosyltransferase involved in cell wall biosynthesis
MLVLPSLSENFGNVVLEAMAHETPVIVTPAVGLADEVRSSGAGVVSDGDPVSLAGSIATLLADPMLRATMGRRGREAAERYAWSRVAEELEQAYASLRKA